MTIVVRHSPALLQHLETYSAEGGGNVAELLFEGGRLSYPGRKELEYQLGATEPYTIEMEARVIEGLPVRTCAAIRLLAREATLRFQGDDLTLDLLWETHNAFATEQEARSFRPSTDRLVAALVMCERAQAERLTEEMIVEASVALVRSLHSIGFPPTREGLEELLDGAYPACVGLGCVDIDSVHR